MVISERFAWGHAKKTGGDAALAYFMLFPQLIQYADDVNSPAKHTSFAERLDQVKGKQLVLNIRRLPAWVLSWAQHKAKYPIDASGQVTPLPSADEMAETREPDGLLHRWTHGGKLTIDRWLRMEYLAWDFLDFIAAHAEVSEAQRTAILRMGIVKQREYDHEVSRWFTPQQIERLYANNPKWAALERLVYPDAATEAVLQQAQRQERAAMKSLSDAESGRASDGLVFVLGSPRSGTTALGKSIAQHSAFHTSSESQILVDLFSGKKITEHFTRPRLDGTCWLTREGISPAELAGFLGIGMAALFSRVAKGKRWVDHTPAYTSMAPTLADMFPHARFVHILRDGRRVVNSMIHFLVGKPPQILARIRLANNVPWAVDFREACRTWSRSALAASQFCAEHPTRAMTVRYESMVSEPEQTFAAIYRFLDAPDEPAAAQYLRTNRGNSSFKRGAKSSDDPWHDWTDEQRRIFAEEAGPAMVKLRLATAQELAVPGLKIPELDPVQIQKVAGQVLPETAVAVVISKGDEELLRLGAGRRAWHFPCNEQGQFTGSYPGDSAEAVKHLEEMRKRGAQYLIVPDASRWWLSHYAAFADHLGRYRRVLGDEAPCVIFDLQAPEAVTCQ